MALPGHPGLEVAASRELPEVIPRTTSQGTHTVRLLSPVEGWVEHRLVIEVQLRT